MSFATYSVKLILNLQHHPVILVVLNRGVEEKVEGVVEVGHEYEVGLLEKLLLPLLTLILGVKAMRAFCMT